MVIRAQIFIKNAQNFFFNAQAKMLSFKIKLRLKCSDENKCSDKNAQMKINAQIKTPSSKKCSDQNDQLYPNDPFEMLRTSFFEEHL